jgi:hypothetical protein
MAHRAHQARKMERRIIDAVGTATSGLAAIAGIMVDARPAQEPSRRAERAIRPIY